MANLPITEVLLLNPDVEGRGKLPRQEEKSVEGIRLGA